MVWCVVFDLFYVELVFVVVDGVEVVVVVIEWWEFCDFDLVIVFVVSIVWIIVDVCNCLDFVVWCVVGWIYFGMGCL